ncbi:MAG: hypothetical protein M1819_004260 [Sarea resinae]|nr:MAG: hypothetical protein M1819_004260 [Sarea resinae]
MHLSPRNWLWLLLAAAVAQGQYMIDSLSFGHQQSLSPNRQTIPGWHITGEGEMPQLLSDRVVLTPPYPGNRRGALWAENRQLAQEWTADFEFRASGPERGGGNLQIWYEKDGESLVGTSSIYTIGQFDGLVLVVDMYGGKGGTVRGFLNDGTTDYKSHHAVDSLSFGHCEYPYRNLGRPSHVQIHQAPDFFEVLVDNQVCFRTDKVKLPAGYFFGVSAASAESPDSFEAYKFLVSTTSAFTREEVRMPPPIPQDYSGAALDSQQQQQLLTDDATPPSSYKTTDAQFADLHNRLQLMSHQMTRLYKTLDDMSARVAANHQELQRRVIPAVPYDQFNSIDGRVQRIEQVLQEIRKDVAGGKDYKDNLDKLQDALRDTHANLLQSLPQSVGQIINTSSPRMGLFIFVVLVFQLGLAAAYVVYKRRRASAPKKYL